MILECSYCGGKMRVDPGMVPPGKRVKVRCPHCNGIGFAEPEASVGQGAAPRAVSSTGVAGESRTTGQASPAGPTDIPEEDASPAWDPTIPSDGFRDFRFPAEAQLQPSEGIASRFRSRAILWIGISLGIILFFAALVNIVVRGPAR